MGESDRVRRLKRVGAMVETPAFHTFLTARENLRVSADYGGIAHAGIAGVLDAVGLADRADERVSEFSLGMRQRLGLARAMLGEPRVMILDEPTTGMDPRGIGEVRALIQISRPGCRHPYVLALLAEVSQSATRWASSVGWLVHTVQ